MGKVVMVVSDALRDDTARAQMGYLQHLVEAGRATRYTVVAELPTMSRPLYETLHTGVPVSVHGVTNNLIVRRSTMPNVFEEAVKHGRTTGASAYGWFSELYNRAPYDRIADREVDDPGLGIQHGRFYMEDNMPDREVFLAGASVILKYQPDYVLIHPMGMDHLGESYGSDSPEYRNNAIFQDMALANLIPGWLERGYTVLVTADHGINNDRLHGGTLPDVRHVPLYWIPKDGRGGGDSGRQVPQLSVAPTLCSLLGIPIPKTMQGSAID
ncbi:MAG TPA: alkaline phosphatase family protein [Anaerolineales bacterium]|nr:alkaline phosphatase family protein [Anaerolineales bacterium]